VHVLSSYVPLENNVKSSLSINSEHDQMCNAKWISNGPTYPLQRVTSFSPHECDCLMPFSACQLGHVIPLLLHSLFVNTVNPTGWFCEEKSLSLCERDMQQLELSR